MFFLQFSISLTNGSRWPKNIWILRIRIRNTSVSDPYSFFTDPDPEVGLETNTDPDTDPDPIRIQGFNDQKLKKNYSWKKN